MDQEKNFETMSGDSTPVSVPIYLTTGNSEIPLNVISIPDININSGTTELQRQRLGDKSVQVIYEGMNSSTLDSYTTEVIQGSQDGIQNTVFPTDSQETVQIEVVPSQTSEVTENPGMQSSDLEEGQMGLQEGSAGSSVIFTIDSTDPSQARIVKLDSDSEGTQSYEVKASLQGLLQLLQGQQGSVQIELPAGESTDQSVLVSDIVSTEIAQTNVPEDAQNVMDGNVAFSLTSGNSVISTATQETDGRGYYILMPGNAMSAKQNEQTDAGNVSKPMVSLLKNSASVQSSLPSTVQMLQMSHDEEAPKGKPKINVRERLKQERIEKEIESLSNKKAILTSLLENIKTQMEIFRTEVSDISVSSLPLDDSLFETSKIIYQMLKPMLELSAEIKQFADQGQLSWKQSTQSQTDLSCFETKSVWTQTPSVSSVSGREIRQPARFHINQDSDTEGEVIGRRSGKRKRKHTLRYLRSSRLTNLSDQIAYVPAPIVKEESNSQDTSADILTLTVPQLEPLTTIDLNASKMEPMILSEETTAELSSLDSTGDEPGATSDKMDAMKVEEEAISKVSDSVIGDGDHSVPQSLLEVEEGIPSQDEDTTEENPTSADGTALSTAKLQLNMASCGTTPTMCKTSLATCATTLTEPSGETTLLHLQPDSSVICVTTTVCDTSSATCVTSSASCDTGVVGTAVLTIDNAQHTGKDMLQEVFSLEKTKKTKRDYEAAANFKFFCKECSFRTKRQSHYAHHLKHHEKNPKIYHCKLCDFKTIRNGELRKHEIMHSTEVYKCPQCKYVTDDMISMNRHRRLKHRASNKQQDHFVCLICKFKSASLKRLEAHMQTHKEPKDEPVQLSIEYTCELCTYKTRRKEHYVRHKKNVHTDHRPYLCDTCGQAFKRGDALTQHKLVHVEKQSRKYGFSCSKCSKGFRSKAHLRDHMSMHSSDRHFLCDICGSAFKTRSSQQKHIKNLHQTPRSFSCSTCEKKFNTNYALRRHERTHEPGPYEKAAVSMLAGQEFLNTNEVTVNTQALTPQELVQVQDIIAPSIEESYDSANDKLQQAFSSLNNENATAIMYLSSSLPASWT